MGTDGHFHLVYSHYPHPNLVAKTPRMANPTCSSPTVSPTDDTSCGSSNHPKHLCLVNSTLQHVVGQHHFGPGLPTATVTSPQTPCPRLAVSPPRPFQTNWAWLEWFPKSLVLTADQAWAV